ncbi:MAG: hypothetical protein PUC88_00105 [Clostridia bacterium]|nr:hypothetical protein [Clostridia bacterium]
MKLFKKLKKEDGSLTIEASISMVFFSIVMVGLLTLINACRVQATVQNALDKSALELSQMMYLYEATGLYYVTVDVSGDATNAANTAVNTSNAINNGYNAVNDVINNGSNSQLGKEMDSFMSPGGLASGIYSLYSGFKSKGDSTDSEMSVGDATSVVINSVNGEDGTLTSTYETIRSGLKTMSDDPVNFIMQLGKYGLNSKTSYMFGASLGESITTSYLGANNEGIDEETYANERLMGLGVKDGISGLNFKKSSVFAPSSPTNVNLIVTYDVEIFPLLGDFKVTFAQSASTRAWLGGDLTVSKASGYSMKKNTDKQNPTPNTSLPAVG